MEKEYYPLEIVVKIPQYSKYERDVHGQDYDIFVKTENKVFCYTNIKPSKLSQVLEVVIFNPALEVDSIPE